MEDLLKPQPLFQVDDQLPARSFNKLGTHVNAMLLVCNAG